MDISFYMRDSYLIDEPFISEKGYKAINLFIKALFYLAPVIVFLYYKYKGKKNRKKITSIEEIDKIEEDKYYNSLFMGTINAMLFIFLAVRVYWFYKPTDSEISLQILINYLKNNNILDVDISKILDRYKPDNISYIIQQS